MPTSSHNVSSATDDEIDIRQLACTLWKSKVTVIVTALITTVLAAVYAYTATPVYQTSVGLSPLPDSALIELNASPIALSPTQASDLLGHFLLANTTKSQFAKQVLPQYAGATLPSINIIQKPSAYIVVVFRSSQPQYLQPLINSYVGLAADAAQKELDARLDATRALQLKKLEQDVSITIQTTLAALNLSTEKELPTSSADEVLRSRLAKAQTTLNTRVTIPWYVMDSPAVTPNAPIKPRKHLIIAFGFMLGGLLGACLVLLKQWFRRL